jgi:peroxiredoxin
MKLLLRIALTLVAFSVACGATYVLVHRWKAVAADPETNVISSTGNHDTLEGVSGLNVGETVDLPQLTTPGGEIVDLSRVGKERLLCVFISTRCPGCTRDAELWQELNREAVKRNAGFYLIDVSDERAEVERFVAAYNLQQLSILFDPTHKVGPQLKVGFVPQYILFAQNGHVVHRWDGIRHYDKSGSSERLAEYFQPR